MGASHSRRRRSSGVSFVVGEEDGAGFEGESLNLPLFPTDICGDETLFGRRLEETDCEYKQTLTSRDRVRSEELHCVGSGV